MVTKAISTLTLLLLFFSTGTFASVTAEVNSALLYDGESLQLSITASDTDADQPDLEPLKKDFELAGTSTSTSMQWINGKSTSSKKWNIILFPREIGDITIPPIRVGNELTDAIRIKVLPTKQASSNDSAQPVFIEIDLPQETFYVQQQIPVSIKLFHSVRISDGTLTEPEIADALIEKTAEDTYETIRNNTRYRVIERKYSVFPQKSGSLEFPEIIFTGNIIEQKRSPSNDPFFGGGIFNRMMQTARPVRIRSEQPAIEVAPIPDQYTGQWWLPARAITLEQQWSIEEPLHTGDPITRTVIIRAEGLTGGQLPNLGESVADNIKIYPDQPVIQTLKQNDTLIGARTEKLTYIVNNAGQVNLPAITLHWWDTDTQEQKTLTLEGKTVLIEAGKTQTQPPAPTSQTDATPDIKQLPAPETTVITDAEPASTLWIWATVIMSCLWLLTLFAWFRTRQRLSATPSPASHALPKDNSQQISKQLRQACMQNDARQSYQLFNQWCANKFPDQNTAPITACRKNMHQAEFIEALDRLEKSLYQAGNETWNGQDFWDSIQQAEKTMKNRKDQKNNNSLQPLYPDPGQT